MWQLERGRLTHRSLGCLQKPPGADWECRARKQPQALGHPPGLDWRPRKERTSPMPRALRVLFLRTMWLVLGSHGKHLEDVARVQWSLRQQEKGQRGHPVPPVVQAFLDLHFWGGLPLQREMALEKHVPPAEAALLSLWEAPERFWHVLPGFGESAASVGAQSSSAWVAHFPQDRACMPCWSFLAHSL